MATRASLNAAAADIGCWPEINSRSTATLIDLGKIVDRVESYVAAQAARVVQSPRTAIKDITSATNCVSYVCSLAHGGALLTSTSVQRLLWLELYPRADGFFDVHVPEPFADRSNDTRPYHVAINGKNRGDERRSRGDEGFLRL